MDLMPWMQQQGMLPAAGETVLCAVSGGRDSVCLLHYLASLGRRRSFAVAAAHYNHLMRPTAGRDEAFVAGLCRELGVPLYVERGDVRAIARQEGWGVEEAGRRLRYDFLERTADAIGASRIATAHHLSDQAETVVLNLLRGTGPEGLAGIPPVRGRLIRPLLQTPRQEIEAYLTAHGLGHVEDETNDSMDFTRNRLRREVWPLLAQLHPAPERSIARAAAILRRENVFLDRLARSYLETAVSDCPSAGEPNAPEISGRRDPAAPSPAPPPGTLPEESSKSDKPSECTRTGDISPDFTSAPTAVSVSEAVLRSAPDAPAAAGAAPRREEGCIRRPHRGPADPSGGRDAGSAGGRHGMAGEGCAASGDDAAPAPTPDPVGGGAGLGRLSRPGVEKRKKYPAP